MQRCCIIHDCYVGGIFLGSVQAYIPIQRCRHVDLLNSEFFVPCSEQHVLNALLVGCSDTCAAQAETYSPSAIVAALEIPCIRERC